MQVSLWALPVYWEANLGYVTGACVGVEALSWDAVLGGERVPAAEGVPTLLVVGGTPLGKSPPKRKAPTVTTMRRAASASRMLPFRHGSIAGRGEKTGVLASLAAFTCVVASRPRGAGVL